MARLLANHADGPVSVLYDWDDNGNLVERGTDTFGWDYEDRMVSATVNSIASTFAYRGDGLRHSRTTGMTTTTFTWDIASGLPTVIDDGNQYVYGAAGLNAMKQGGNWYYYLADGLGSTMAVVNASGVVQNSYTYDVYGEASVTGALANEFDFAGQQTDSTGLQYLRARYMDPETGTFLSRDPLAVKVNWLGGGQGYVSANPLNRTDPTGLCYEYGDPGDPWCKDQQKPEENVHPHYEVPRDSEPKIIDLPKITQAAAEKMMSLIEEYGRTKAMIAAENQGLYLGITNLDKIGDCAADTYGCALAMSHSLGILATIACKSVLLGVVSPGSVAMCGIVATMAFAWETYVYHIQSSAPSPDVILAEGAY